MNRDLVENILRVIKTSTDKNVILKGLVKLRTDLIKDREGIVLFREVGGVPPMIRFLNKPYEKILEVVLSILGNCCTDEASSLEAFDCKITLPLTSILKSISNTVIQCRVCRLLGNLAKHDCEQLLATNCPAIAQSISQIIHETEDIQTRLMALRACRILLAHSQFLKEFLICEGFDTLLKLFEPLMKSEAGEVDVAQAAAPPSPVGRKIKQHREKYFEEVVRNLEGVRSDIFDHEVLKNYERPCNIYALPKEKNNLEVACEILKCLQVISEMELNMFPLQSLNRNQCTFAPIVHFVAEDNRHRSVGLKILSNFSKHPTAALLLSQADAIVAACDLLVSANMGKPLSVSEVRHCLNIIAMLSSDACNRSKIRRSGALRKLMIIAKASQSQTEKSLILYLFNNFQYDDKSMELMLREGLITFLTNELNIYLDSDDEYHKRKRDEKKQNSKKRKLTEQACKSSCKLPKLPLSQDILLDSESPSSSPRSPASSCSSRSMSPLGSSFTISNDNEDASYSPVYSDDDGDDDDEEDDAMQSSQNASTVSAGSSDNCDIMQYLDIACRSETIEDNVLEKEDDEETNQDTPTLKIPQIGNLPRGTIDIIENLFFRITLLVNKCPELGKPETMTTLIKAITTFGLNNSFSSSLTNILLESHFFAQVIKHSIPHQLLQVTKPDEFTRDDANFLETLTCVGESNYGKAQLASFLRSDNVATQNCAAIAVALIVRNRNLLYQFLNDGNALTMLLGIILSRTKHEFQYEAVDALTYMAKHTLGFAVKTLDRDARKIEYDEFDLNEQLVAPSSCDIRFLVHEEEGPDALPVLVEFSKNILCESSDVFSTMLTSDFRERKENEVHLSTCTAVGLRYFLNLLVRLKLNKGENIPKPEHYHALLEAFELSRMYIIPEMERVVERLLIMLLDERNCLKLLEWALINHHSELTCKTIAYYLSSTLPAKAKIELYQTADYSTYSSEWFDLLIDAVYSRVRSRRF